MNQMKIKWRYVEVSYVPPSGDTQFFATINKTESPDVALMTATAMCANKHPDALEIQEFMQRVVPEERAIQIQSQMRDGTWEGWDFQKDH